MSLVVYAGLHAKQLYPLDQKIPFQWIQPGNTGNTGGGSGKPHGKETWTTSPQNGPTVIHVAPKNIAPESDNFFNYMVLPYPAAPPKRSRATVGDWSAATPTDWSKSQQMEGPQVEYFGGGFQYTACIAFNPHTGLRCWNGKSWEPIHDATGQPIVIALDKPTAIAAEYLFDCEVKHTFTYDWVVINGVYLHIGKTMNAIVDPHHYKQFATACQLDCQAAAPPYQAVLNQLTVEVE